MKAKPSELNQVVSLNETAKTILAASRQVDLRALDAMVRGRRGGENLRGFAEVSSQMRAWSRELAAATKQVSELSGELVLLVSASLRRRRLLRLLGEAARDAPQCEAIALTVARWRIEFETLDVELLRARRSLILELEGIEQLGLMACVLARAAAIEAMSGNEAERTQLSAVSREFATHSDQISDQIRTLLSEQRRSSR